jgi:D-amino-acid dehydrogenase
VGLRPSTPDSLPVLGRLRQHPDVIVAGGLGGFGLQAGPYTGHVVALLALGDDGPSSLEVLSPDRFG